jgi:hypothetical protein
MFNGYQQLNEKERAFLGLLTDVDSNSIWGVAISNVVKNPDVSKVRRLICDLKSQAHDCGEVMQSILGEPCYFHLQNL